MNTIHLCFGDPNECQNCGGWIGCGGIDGGIVADHGRFCSEECCEEAADFQEQMRERVTASREADR